MNSGVSGKNAPGEFAESEPRVDLSMGRRVFEIPKGYEGFRGPAGKMHQASSQNLNLE